MSEDQIRELAYHLTDVLADRWHVNRCGTDQADDVTCVEAFLRGRLTVQIPEDQIRDVIAQWRARAEGQGAIYASSLLDCADELERLLTERPQPQEAQELIREAMEIMTIVYAGNFPAGIESFLIRADRALRKSEPLGSHTP